MENTFLLYSVHEGDALFEAGKETLERECATYRDAEREADGYYCQTRIYVKTFVTEFGPRPRLQEVA